MIHRRLKLSHEDMNILEETGTNRRHDRYGCVDHDKYILKELLIYTYGFVVLKDVHLLLWKPYLMIPVSHAGPPRCHRLHVLDRTRKRSMIDDSIKFLNGTRTHLLSTQDSPGYNSLFACVVHKKLLRSYHQNIIGRTLRVCRGAGTITRGITHFWRQFGKYYYHLQNTRERL